jgi:hypothetical protein
MPDLQLAQAAAAEAGDEGGQHVVRDAPQLALRGLAVQWRRRGLVGHYTSSRKGGSS